MSSASQDAYRAILPELPRREQAVLEVLLKSREVPGDPGSIRRGPSGMTNHQIAHALGLERDSISPRTSRLKQKGLVVEAGISGKETLYEAALEPQFNPEPSPRRYKNPSYRRGVNDALEVLNAQIGGWRPDTYQRMALEGALVHISELLK